MAKTTNKTKTLKKGAVDTNVAWYNRNVEYLAEVTNDGANPEIGIKQIYVHAPTDKQLEAGVIAKVGIQIMTFIDNQYVFCKGTVREGQSGNLFFAPENSRAYEDKDGNTQWYDAYDLPIAYKAQVLRHVEHMIEE